MADRFRSGQVTDKFEVPLPTHVATQIKGMQSIQAGHIKDLEDYKEEVNKRFIEAEQTEVNRFNEVVNDYTPAKKWVDEHKMTTVHTNQQFGFFICKLAKNPIIRFLNYFFHWFHLIVYRTEYWSSYKHDKYYVMVTISEYDSSTWMCGSDYMSKEWKRRRREHYKNERDILRRDLKRIKPEGYKLSNMHFRF